MKTWGNRPNPTKPVCFLPYKVNFLPYCTRNSCNKVNFLAKFPGFQKIWIPKSQFLCNFLKGNPLFSLRNPQNFACGAITSKNPPKKVDFQRRPKKVYLIANKKKHSVGCAKIPIQNYIWFVSTRTLGETVNGETVFKSGINFSSILFSSRRCFLSLQVQKKGGPLLVV